MDIGYSFVKINKHKKRQRYTSYEPRGMRESFRIDLLSPLENVAKTAKEKESAHLQAVGKVEWLMAHYFPSKLKKAKINVALTSPSRGLIELNYENNTRIDNNAEKKCQEESSFDPESFEKGVWSALKKLIVEDLGNMNAAELQESIPDEDSEGRGMNDLFKFEKKLAVKVVFDEISGHVLLVGDQKKLEKKVFVLRNMISHYHWRLSGRDVAFDEVTSKKE